MSILMDTQKDFDSLDRNILLAKLTFYGNTGTELEWLRSFLNDRRQYVKYSNCKSIWRCALHGWCLARKPSPINLFPALY